MNNPCTLFLTSRVHLSDLQRDDDDMVLGARAIYISEENLAERTAQMQLMRSIYIVQHVCVWLVLSTPSAECAMQEISQLDRILLGQRFGTAPV
jgi:hypothetical protein